MVDCNACAWPLCGDDRGCGFALVKGLSRGFHDGVLPLLLFRALLAPGLVPACGLVGGAVQCILEHHSCGWRIVLDMRQWDGYLSGVGASVVS